MSETSDLIWERFDALTALPGGSPWDLAVDPARYVADLDLLRELLAVPIHLQAQVRSGLHAKAVDVWIAAELRRAGVGADEVWPRPSLPRVLPREVALVLGSVPPVRP